MNQTPAAQKQERRFQLCARALQLHREGLNNVQIAQRLGAASKQTVRLWIRTALARERYARSP